METEFKPIPGFEIYHVSPDGTIKNSKRGNILKPCAYEGNKYYMVGFMLPPRRIFKKYVHRIVAEAWLPNPDPQNYDSVGFRDKNTKNFNVKNLYWTNQQELMALRKEQNKYSEAESHHMARFTWEDIDYIRGCFKDNIKTQSELAREYAVLPCTINAIVNNKSWKAK